MHAPESQQSERISIKPTVIPTTVGYSCLSLMLRRNRLSTSKYATLLKATCIELGIKPQLNDRCRCLKCLLRRYQSLIFQSTEGNFKSALKPIIPSATRYKCVNQYFHRARIRLASFEKVLKDLATDSTGKISSFANSPILQPLSLSREILIYPSTIVTPNHVVL
jgi:hypothetical protein